MSDVDDAFRGSMDAQFGAGLWRDRAKAAEMHVKACIKRIAELEAEVERLKDAAHPGWMTEISLRDRRIAKLEAEVAQLRTAHFGMVQDKEDAAREVARIWAAAMHADPRKEGGHAVGAVVAEAIRALRPALDRLVEVMRDE